MQKLKLKFRFNKFSNWLSDWIETANDLNRHFRQKFLT